MGGLNLRSKPLNLGVLLDILTKELYNIILGID